jgi:hypothetical protein
VLPLVVLAQLGFVIGVGVLLDTLVVRSIIVPALVYDAGSRVWWPSKLAHGHQDRREPEPAGEPVHGAIDNHGGLAHGVAANAVVGTDDGRAPTRPDLPM